MVQDQILSPNNSIWLITTCTHRKRVTAPMKLRASSLPKGRHDAVLKEWQNRLSNHPTAGKAVNIYCGRSFKESIQSKEFISANLLIISAGLGLVSDGELIPSYSLTLTDTDHDSIRLKIAEPFDPIRWWKGINLIRNGKEHPIYDLITNHQGLFVFALNQSYARLIQQELLFLSDKNLSKVRLIGLAIKPVLESRLHQLIMPFDERFDGPDGVNIGTRSDFASRAMKHFVTTILPDSWTAGAHVHADTVKQFLADRRYPAIPKRTRISDKELIQMIIKYAKYSKVTSSKMLRILRDDEKIACEQRRFQQLFKEAQEQVSI